MKYQKRKLLADCYAFLKPGKTLLDKYINSLEEARAADRIDERTFLFLRTHKVVLNSLMDITKGDYARFNSSTYLEVYEDIKTKAQRQYRDEVAAHEETLKRLRTAEENAADEHQKDKQTIEELSKRTAYLEETQKQQMDEKFERKVSFVGWVVTIVLAGIPYLVVFVGVELFKMLFTDYSWLTVAGITIAALLTIIIGLLFNKVKSLCFEKIRKELSKRWEN